MSGSEALNFCLGLLRVCSVMIASPPIRSINPRYKRSIITLTNLVRIIADHLEFHAGTSRGKYKDFHLQNKTWSRCSITAINLILA